MTPIYLHLMFTASVLCQLTIIVGALTALRLLDPFAAFDDYEEQEPLEGENPLWRKITPLSL